MQVLLMTIKKDVPFTTSEQIGKVASDCGVQIVALDSLHHKGFYSVEFMEGSTVEDVKRLMQAMEDPQ
jgi:hypothetical protein